MAYSSDEFSDEDVDFDQIFNTAKIISAGESNNDSNQKSLIENEDILPKKTIVAPLHNTQSQLVNNRFSQSRLQRNQSTGFINVPVKGNVDGGKEKPKGVMVHTEGETSGIPTTTEIVTLKGENALLRSKLEKMASKFEKDQKDIKEDFQKKLQEDQMKMISLTNSLTRFKEDNEFLTSENKNLNSKYLQQLNSKKRKLNDDANSISSNYGTSNGSGGGIGHDSAMSTSATSTSSGSHLSQRNNSQPSPQVKTIYKTKVAIMNQTTVLQDEKNSFIESISTFVIPGMSKSTLDVLSTIKSPIDFQYKDFQIPKNKDTLKTEFINFLINYENHNRIDLLLSDFVIILIEFIKKLSNDDIEDESYLLIIVFLMSSINCSINYRPKAISTEVIDELMKFTFEILNKFNYIIKQDDIDENDDDDRSLLISNYQKRSERSPNMIRGNGINSNTNNSMNETKPVRDKILETFITIFGFDILENITKISINNKNQFKPGYFKNYYKDFIMNYCLSNYTPIGFINNTIEIINNLIIFLRDQPRSKMSELNDILLKLMKLLNEGLFLNFNFYGLNRFIGSNENIKFLNSFVTNTTLNTTLSKRSDGSVKHNYFKLCIRLKILEFFEIYLSYNTRVKNEILVELISNFINLLNKQQEIISRLNHEESEDTNLLSLRMKIINKLVKLIHFLITPDGDLKISNLPIDLLRELIISFLRVSSISIKPLLNYEFFKRLRENDGYYGFVFNKKFENDNFIKWEIRNDSDANHGGLDGDSIKELIKCDLYNSNGYEINYDDEIIELSRDVLSYCVTADEADMLYYSMNYLIDEEDSNQDIDMDY